MSTSERESRAYKDAIDAENWRMCQLVYKQLNSPTVHVDHKHDPNPRKGSGVRGMNEQFAIKSDLNYNHCRRVLGKYWAEY